MPGKLDSVMVPLAKKLVGDFGHTVTYKAITKTFAPGTGVTTNTTTSYTGVVITPPEPYKQNRINETTIKTGDVMTSVSQSAISFTPQIGDAVTLNGADWEVVAVNWVYSGEQVALYELQLRR
jgi:hypothetical protein